MNDKILATIYSAIDELNNLLPEGERVLKSPETILVGEAGVLDSLGIINLVVALEAQIQFDYSVAISLVDAAALPAAESPFRSIASLVDFLTQKLEHGNAQTG